MVLSPMLEKYGAVLPIVQVASYVPSDSLSAASPYGMSYAFATTLTVLPFLTASPLSSESPVSASAVKLVPSVL